MQNEQALSHPGAIDPRAERVVARGTVTRLGRVLAGRRLRTVHLRRLQQLQQMRQRVRSDHDVDHGARLDLAPVLLRQAPRGAATMRSDGAYNGFRCRGCRTGGCPRFCSRIAHVLNAVATSSASASSVSREQAGDPLRVVLVHLAPEGADQIRALHGIEATPTWRTPPPAVSRTSPVIDLARVLQLLLDLLRDVAGITCPEMSSTSSGLTITRTSRPACIAYVFSTPGHRGTDLLEALEALARTSPRIPGERRAGRR